MIFGRADSTPFRPAPFPVYPDDTQRRGLERLRNASLALCLCLALLPVFAGPSAELSVPVYYARVELGERAPVSLQLALPAADYEVSPASLGYFAGDGEFVYSAEVARGLIYGRRNGEVLVVEIGAPNSSALYLERQLELIRGQVEAVNGCRNMLRLARSENPLKSSAAMRLMTALRKQLGTDLSGPLPDSWQELLPAGDEANAGLLEATLAGYARQRIKLKRLFYESQSARLELMLSEYDLQLGLARLPQPRIDELFSLGDENLAQATMLEEIDRLSEAWQARREQLVRQTADDGRLLEHALSAAGSGPPDPLEMALGPYAPLSETASSTRDEAASPKVGDYSWFPSYEECEQQETAGENAGDPLDSWQAMQSLLEARLQIAAAELTQLDERLVALKEARRHVKDGGVPSWTELPHHAPQLERLRLSGLEALEAFAHIEAESRTPQTAAPLLLALAQEFERPGAASGSLVAEWSLTPDEVAYGLLAVDRCRLGPVGEPAENASLGPPRKLLDELGAILAFPADYDTAAYNLGFLEFIQWYASLDRIAVAEPEPPAGDQPDDTEEPAGGGDEQQTDVDSLFS